MKYLVLNRQKDSFLMLPQEQRIQIWEGMVAFVETYRAAGKCKAIYNDGDMKGGVSIWEADSDEEAVKYIFENPISPFMDLDIRPIGDWDIGVKATRDYFQSLPK